MRYYLKSTEHNTEIDFFSGEICLLLENEMF
jgi:hypothetical protein